MRQRHPTVASATASMESGTRVVDRAWLLLLLLAVALAWMPMVAYPSSGRWLLLVGALLLLTATLLRGRADDATRAAWIPGLWALALAAFAWVRWAAGGFAFGGADGLTTLLFALTAGFTSHALLRAWIRPDCSGGARTLLRRLLLAFAGGGLLCGLHAITQRLFIYDRMHGELLAEIGTAQPTPLQLGLLHHFALKRVASVWGDPNALGAFLAVATLASLILAATAFRRRSGWAAGAVGIIAVPCAVTGIWFSGSRGALLDLVIGLGLVAVAWVARRRSPTSGRRGPHPGLTAAAVLLGAGMLLSVSGRGEAVESAQVPSTVGVDPVVRQAEPAGWKAMLARSDTLRERAHYALVGTRIFELSPVFGAGPGAVDQLYGRFKPPEARESKYLHNWILQIAAEYGVIGLLLAGGLLWGMGAGVAHALRRGSAEEAACAVMFTMLVCDGLYQLSFNQRELMMLCGILGGVVVAVSPRVVAAHTPAVPSARARTIGAIVLFALTLHSGLPALHSLRARQLAETELENGRPAAAVGVLRRARSLAPRDPQSWAMEARIVADREGPAAALPLMQRAVAISPSSASLRSSLADLLSAAGRKDDALAAVRIAVELYPTKADYRAQLSRMLEERGDMDGALREARLAVRHAYLFGEQHGARLDALEARVGVTTGTQDVAP